MDITKDNFEKNIEHEWLITNGIGGYASSTICDCNTRKYHGLLVAALGNSGERFLCLSKINESIIIKGEEYSLSTNECSNFIEKGYLNQESFTKTFLPKYTYNVKNVFVTKEIAMKYGENKVAVLYNIKTSNEDVILDLKPLVNYRNFHSTRTLIELNQESRDNFVKIELNSHGTYLYMNVSDGEYTRYENTYYRNMFYREEEERGLDAYDSHYMPGCYSIRVPKESEVSISFVATVCSEELDNLKPNAKDIINSEKVRLEKVCKIAGADTYLEKALAIAADSFIVTKNNTKTIIAGYHWFGDWGRDTFISLEGLTLKLNRFKDAKEIILSFKNYVKDGLIPNVVSEKGDLSYNTVDAPLWYINAIYKYYCYTNDVNFVKEMYDTVVSIISHYKNGTNEIKMDEDGLIIAGNENTNLTWMDAKVDDIIPTPRYGKAVEINALWYNALKIAEVFSNILSVEFDTSLSVKVLDSFKKFYSSSGLYDTIEPISNQIRPNQLIAICLDFSTVEKEKAREIIDLVYDNLYTKKGLRTLDKEDKDYRPYYFGTPKQRDLSYHEGTVWPYLLMYYNNAYRKYIKDTNEDIDYEGMLTEGAIGSVCEIYDGEGQEKPKRSHFTSMECCYDDR